ncbi:MAG: class II glutamine amidotransferase [Sandaracinaceae bacterium]|jgi:predicted glutamine amidotransferase|nr:class II glutamine amidotransferase [Sandaracinaceae bacterium]
MGRLLGYMANRADRLRDALYQERAAITQAPGTTPDGWGMGFYQGGEVLHKKRPQLSGEAANWEDIAGDVRSHCVIAHLRQATVGDFRAENTHPFRMRQWIFAHNGTVDRFAALRERLLEAMPDFVRRNVRGDTDSEHIFAAILSFLHDEGHIDNSEVDDKPVLQAIRNAVALIDRLSGEVGAKPGGLNFVLTNGRKMFALRRGAPMAYVERQGLHDPENQRTSNISLRETAEAAALRYVLIVSDGPTPPAGYATMEDQSILVVDRDLRVTKYVL